MVIYMFIKCYTAALSKIDSGFFVLNLSNENIVNIKTLMQIKKIPFVEGIFLFFTACSTSEFVFPFDFHDFLLSN
jgi:hypothetical protein